MYMYVTSKQRQAATNDVRTRSQSSCHTHLYALVGDVRNDVDIAFIKHLFLVLQIRLEFVAEILFHLLNVNDFVYWTGKTFGVLFHYKTLEKHEQISVLVNLLDT